MLALLQLAVREPERRTADKEKPDERPVQPVQPERGPNEEYCHEENPEGVGPLMPLHVRETIREPEQHHGDRAEHDAR